VDHLDNNPRNNDIANLVPACQRASDAMCCAGSSKLGRRTRAVR
jgi:hypothetical protein